MIALNIDKPKSCLSCPCLWTIGNVPNESNKMFSIRYCAAARKEICAYEEIENMPFPDSFYNFSIPNWCPWVELNKPVYDEDSYWHMSMAGLGGSYEY